MNFPHLLNLAAIYYEDSLFKLPEFDFDEESFWVFGRKGKDTYNNLTFNERLSESKYFPNSGW